MHHFFVDKNAVTYSEITFSIRDYAHMTKVLRLRLGEIVSATDGEFFYTVKLSVLDGLVKGEIQSKEQTHSESPLYTILVQGLAKGEKMDFIIQKATELGVNEIIPVETVFSVVKLDKKKKKERSERWQKIAYEAAKQSKRAAVPIVHAAVALKDVFEMLSSDTQKIILWESENDYGMQRLFKDYNDIKRIALFIGPEGGFAQEEVDLTLKNSTISISLGKRILRTETAGIAALSVIQFALGDLGGKFSAG